MRINAVESSTKGGADASEQEEGDDDGEEGGGEDYEVDRVVSYCKSGLNKNKYLVHWKGVDPSGDAWPDSYEPKAYFVGVPQREQKITDYDDGEDERQEQGKKDKETRRRKQAQMQSGDYGRVYGSKKRKG